MKQSIVVLAIIIAVIVAGCSKSDSTAPQSRTGILQINMIDFPASYDHVNIVIDSVLVHVGTADSAEGWTTLNRVPATYDLLTLVNGANAVLASATLPVGLYSQIRLYIGTGSTVVIDGVTKPLITPSGSQSGVKLNVDAMIQPDMTYILTLDFDANRSIVTSGSPSDLKYSLKPVIRTVAAPTTGIIAGTVSPDSAMPIVWAYGTLDTVSTFADTSGGFKLLFLNPDTYTVYLAPQDTSYKDSTIAAVHVTAGNTTNLGVISLTHK